MVNVFCIHGKELLRKFTFHQKYREQSHFETNVRLTGKLISEQSDEIYGVKTIYWEDSSWKYLSLVGDEQLISLLHTKVCVFSDSVLCLGKMSENPSIKYCLGGQVDVVQKFTRIQSFGQN